MSAAAVAAAIARNCYSAPEADIYGLLSKLDATRLDGSRVTTARLVIEALTELSNTSDNPVPLSVPVNFVLLWLYYRKEGAR